MFLANANKKESIHNISIRGPLNLLFRYLIDSGAADELEVDS
jgi:hypothetical protein